MFKNGVLTGITVIDLSRMLPGPYCSMILADHGARVIAIEDKKYKAEGLFLSPIYRNKEHITLDLKTSEGRKIFEQLVKKADVILEGFRPGVVARLGVDYESVIKINPKIVYCSISGYGQNGPYSDRVGHDVNFLAASGLLDLMGEKNCAPSIPCTQFADIAGGGSAVTGILLALYGREKSGKGQYIDISMTDAMVSFLSVPLYIYQLTGQLPIRSDYMLSHRYACYNTYETADNRYLSIGAVENRFWKILCETLNVPKYAPLQLDENMREEIIEFMRKTFKAKSLAQWEQILNPLDICWGPVRNIEEVLTDPHIRGRGMVVDIEEKEGKKMQILGVPVKLSQTPGSIRTPPVQFGESTDDVLSELGYSKDQIKKLEKKGII